MVSKWGRFGLGVSDSRHVLNFETASAPPRVLARKAISTGKSSALSALAKLAKTWLGGWEFGNARYRSSNLLLSQMTPVLLLAAKFEKCRKRALCNYVAI